MSHRNGDRRETQSYILLDLTLSSADDKEINRHCTGFDYRLTQPRWRLTRQSVGGKKLAAENDVRCGRQRRQLVEEALHVTRVCIVAVEGGKQNLSMDIIVRLANALAVTPEALLANDSDLPPVPRRNA